jgi:hypothetical protein
MMTQPVEYHACICTHILAYSSVAWAAIEVCSEAQTGTHKEYPGTGNLFILMYVEGALP